MQKCVKYTSINNEMNNQSYIQEIQKVVFSIYPSKDLLHVQLSVSVMKGLY